MFPRTPTPRQRLYQEVSPADYIEDATLEKVLEASGANKEQVRCLMDIKNEINGQLHAVVNDFLLRGKRLASLSLDNLLVGQRLKEPTIYIPRGVLEGTKNNWVSG